MPKSSRRQGFSLVQMLVATAVAMGVLGLILPGVQTVKQTAIRTQCSNNLHNLALAYHNWKDANDPKVFATNSWVSELTRYVEDVRTMYNCPLDQASWLRTDSEIYVRIYWKSGSNTYPLVIYDINGPDITSGENYDDPQLNGGIVQVAKDQSVGIRSRKLTDTKKYSVPATSPEGSWIAEFETTWATNNTGIGHALDWNDLFLLVEPQKNNTTKITYFAGDPVGGFGGNEIFDILDQNRNPVAMDVRAGQSGYVPLNGRGVSYGINSLAHRLSEDLSSKVLLLEYKNTIARVVSPAPFDINLSFYPQNVAARHRGMLNVLYADGHVEVKMPADIDPQTAALQTAIWNPFVPK